MERKKSEYDNEIFPAAASSAPPWIELPYDVTANILKRLNAEEILRSAQNVCATWWKVCHDPAMWRVVDLECRNLKPKLQSQFGHMCRTVVDRTHGQLTDLTITRFQAELLLYIAHRSSNLRRLTVVRVYGSVRDSLNTIFGNFWKLEVLQLVMMPLVYADDVASIGRNCPMLKSFTFVQHNSDYQVYEKYGGKSCKRYDEAIVSSMPNLRRLQLSSDWITNKALTAILDGCPLLEELRIRGCFRLNLRGKLGKRCRPMEDRYFMRLNAS